MENLKSFEKNLRTQIEKGEDSGGDLHLELAKNLIAQEKYDDACECLLFCINADTAVREAAYPLIVDLLAMGHCIDSIPHSTFEWLRLDCYIEPDRKKAMYLGIALNTEKLNKIANALECYILDFGGDENVGTLYDRLEDLTFEQMPNVDFYDYSYFELAHDALCEKIEMGMPLDKLSDYRLASICNHTTSDEILTKVQCFIIENRDRDILRERLFGTEEGLDENVRLIEHYIEKKNYDVLAWLYNENKVDCIWDWEEANESIFSPIIDSILASDDIETVSSFIEAMNDSECEGFGGIGYEPQYKLIKFVSDRYLDENGAIQKEWGDLTEIYRMLVDKIFDIVSNNAEFEDVFGNYSTALVKNAFETCKDLFTDEALEENFVDWNGELTYDTAYGGGIEVEDKEAFLIKVKDVLKMAANMLTP